LVSCSISIIMVRKGYKTSLTVADGTIGNQTIGKYSASCS
jgi:hypothetical protein